jgi:hypothetical protein
VALETASTEVLVVGIAFVESSRKAIPHLDADTGLDLRGTRKGEGVHGGLACGRHRNANPRQTESAR